MLKKVHIDDASLIKFITTNLNNTLDINRESSFTNSFSIHLAKEDKGMFFIPNLPVSYVLDRDLYFKIADICSGILYPYKTLLLQNNAIFFPYKIEEQNLARAFFFPWMDGIPTRLTIPDIHQFIKSEVSESYIPLMANQVNFNLNDVVHMAISGSSGSGKSYFLEYLIRCIHKITDDIIAVDPKKQTSIA